MRHGYTIVEQVVPHDLIDAMLADLDGLFVADEAIDGISFDGLEFDDGHHTTTAHRELLQRPVADRLAARDRSAWRLHAFFCYSAAADAVRRHGELGRIASMILGVDSEAHYSINFHNGSQQDFHEDTAVFHLRVPTLICGVWIACEDIVEGSGPLLYCPGSHRRPPFGFDGYPLANLQTADPETAAAYDARVSADAAGFEPQVFLARKGDVLFWHGMLIHGGAPITRPGTTRRSYVLHFIPDGVDVTAAT